MLEVKSPWDKKFLDKVSQNNEKDIDKIIEKASLIAKNKGLDFKPSKRIEVLKKFSKKIKANIDELAVLAASEGGKPLKDSIIEIKRGADGVDSCIEVLKTETGSVIPMDIDAASESRVAFTQKEPSLLMFNSSNQVLIKIA